jgi:hypothetical protein
VIFHSYVSLPEGKPIMFPTQVSIQAGRIISRLAESEAGLLRLLRHAVTTGEKNGASAVIFQQNMLGLSGFHMGMDQYLLIPFLGG